MIRSVCNQIEDHKNMAKKEHGLVACLLTSVNTTMPADMRITQYDNFNIRKRQTDNTQVTTINVSTLVILARGEIPKGSTIARTMDIESAMVAARNEVCTLYNEEKKATWQSKEKDDKRTSRGDCSKYKDKTKFTRCVCDVFMSRAQKI